VARQQLPDNPRIARHSDTAEFRPMAADSWMEDAVCAKLSL